jgi:hypothetical protein
MTITDLLIAPKCADCPLEVCCRIAASPLRKSTGPGSPWLRLHGGWGLLLSALINPDYRPCGYSPHRSASIQQSSGIDPSSELPSTVCEGRKKQEERMLRLIAVAGFALAVTTSAQAITPAPIPQPDGMITQVRLGCGPGRTRVAGVCVARTTIRHTRRMARRAYRRGNY